MSFSRREFLQVTAGAAAGLASAGSFAWARDDIARSEATEFDIAPRLGQFQHHAPAGVADEVQFLADLGFCTVDDPRFLARPPEERRRLGDVAAWNGLRLGACEGVVEFRRPTFASATRSVRLAAFQELQRAIEAVAEAGGRSIAIVPGRVERMNGRSTWNDAVETLRRAADVAAERNVTILIDAIDADRATRRSAAPMLVPTLERAAELCREVGHAACRARVDVYRWSTAGGGVRPIRDLIPVLKRGWDQWAAVQVADAPGGHEPGTGRLDLDGLFDFLRARGFRGSIGLGHGASLPGLEGERAALAAWSRRRTAPVSARRDA